MCIAAHRVAVLERGALEAPQRSALAGAAARGVGGGVLM